ncbi:PhoH family protein [Verrucomicrobiales bacterium]|jgi:phosphate starvation-inducible protein PhoH and related proteins|nr:PhoH family protein [Verrucomicrobiales bacterium]
MAERTIEFESLHFLHSLFAEDLPLLHDMENSLNVRVTTRDAWIKLEGDEVNVEAAVAVIEDLEEARRRGGAISPSTFRYAVNAASESLSRAVTEASAEIEAGDRVSDLFECKLLGKGGKPAVTPRTKNQLRYLEALDRNDVSFGIGPAGTGKTFLAMAYALDLLKKRHVDRILLTRPAVEAGEALGFLPGALEEKVLPYLRPLYDAMSEMLDNSDTLKFTEKNMIEIAPLAYMRGRTLNRACVILDEAQNATREQMFMFLTRLGEDSKCIITGDPSQIDLKPKSKSGLLEAMELLRGIEGIAFTEFEGRDVVRHPVVARIIQAYESGRE